MFPKSYKRKVAWAYIVVGFQLYQLHKLLELVLVLIYARVDTKKQSTKMFINQSQCVQIF